MKLHTLPGRIINKAKYYFLLNGGSINRARALRLGNQFTEAENILTTILRKQPQNIPALVEFAQLASDQCNIQQAATRWEKVLASLNKVSHHNNLYHLKLRAAEAYLADGQTENAMRVFLSIQSHFPEALLGLANCYIGHTQEWTKWVNRYLEHFHLKPIAHKACDGPPFFCLTSSSTPSSEHQTPLVSVIMTAYNMQDFIDVAVRSILAQSWKNLELIIVNDASTDQTGALIDSYRQQDSRVRVIHNPVNVGTYSSRNIALNYCEGVFITTHDSDDWAHPDRIRLQAEHLLSNPGIVGNMSRNVRLNEHGKFEPTSWGTYVTDRCCVSFMFRSDIVRELFGYWDSVRVSADVELIERIESVLGHKSVTILPQPLLFTLRRDNSLTTVPTTLGVGGRASPARQQYRNTFQAWHKTLTRKNCYMPFPLSTRPFEAPVALVVPLEHNTQNLQRSKNQ